MKDTAEEYGVLRCSGIAGVPLYVQDGDNRYDMSAGFNDGGKDFSGPFNEPFGKIEWRLASGKPYAIIFRLMVRPTVGKPYSRLLVETVGRHPCRIAEIDGTTGNANARAREAADRILTGRSKCMKFLGWPNSKFLIDLARSVDLPVRTMTAKDFVEAFEVAAARRQPSWAPISPTGMVKAYVQIVGRIEEGYDDCISEYDNDLSIRGRLGDVISDPSVRLHPELKWVIEAVGQLDSRLRAVLSDRHCRGSRNDRWWYSHLPIVAGPVLAQDLASLYGYVVPGTEKESP